MLLKNSLLNNSFKMNVKNTRASKNPREIVRQFPGLTQSFTLYTIILFCTTFSCVETASAEATRKLHYRQALYQ